MNDDIDFFVYVVLAIVIILAFFMSGQVLAATVPGATISVPMRVMCASGYSATVRPPATYTNKIKRTLVKQQGGLMADYELDHLVPISIGGDPASKDNLWLQKWPDARRKDVREAELHRLVCSGRIPVDKAQDEMKGWK